MSRVTKAIIVSTVFVIFGITVLFFVYYGVVYKSVDNTVANIVNKGNACMDDLNYVGAIEKYVEAMEYEPENDDLKKAIAHAYVCQAGVSEESDAINYYESALSYNSNNTNAYWGLINIYENRGDEDNELLVLQNGYSNTNDENMKVKADNIEYERARIKAEEEARLAEEAEQLAIEEAHNSVLEKLLVLFDTDEIDYDAVKEMLRSEEFIDLSDEVIGADDSFYYGEKDEEGRRCGKGIAVYADGYYYYGDYENDVRSGNGIYIRAVYSESSAIGSFMFEGYFENDKPNGEGTSTSNFYKDKISSSGLAKQVITGEYKDGLENGEMVLSGTTKSGSSVKYKYTAVDGVAEKSSDEDSGIKGQYIIAKSTDEKSNLTSDGSKRGVEGFID